MKLRSIFAGLLVICFTFSCGKKSSEDNAPSRGTTSSDADERLFGRWAMGNADPDVKMVLTFEKGAALLKATCHFDDVVLTAEARSAANISKEIIEQLEDTKVDSKNDDFVCTAEISKGKFRYSIKEDGKTLEAQSVSGGKMMTLHKL